MDYLACIKYAVLDFATYDAWLLAVLPTQGGFTGDGLGHQLPHV
jgi:hypothetical protein